MIELRTSLLAVVLSWAVLVTGATTSGAQNKPKPPPKPQTVATAQPKPRSQSTGTKKPKKTTTNAAAANASLISNLEQTIMMLHKADHDYNGHRIKGVRHLHNAIKQLGGAEPPKDFPDPAGKLPQKASDAFLRQALTKLQSIQPALNAKGPGNRKAAATAVQNARNELQTALKIR